MLNRGEETRVTDPWTGGQKGQKPERFSLLPFDALDEILKGYHYGAQKYADHNWRRGYKWSLSFDAALRHLTAWWEREDKDPESGLSHLAHAGWHVLCLLWFELNDKGTDDRWREAETAPGTLDSAGEVLPSSESSHEGQLDRVGLLEKDRSSGPKSPLFDGWNGVYDPLTKSWFGYFSREVDQVK